MTGDDGRADLEKAYRAIENSVPDRVVRVLRWLRDPKSRVIRLTIGVTLIVLSFGWLLPGIGLWFLPLGLLLIAEDVPWVRRPAAKFMIWLEGRWVDAKRWWRGRHP